MVSAAPAIIAPTSLALSERRNLRFFVVFILYVAQGLPLGLFYFALPAWQAQNGASAAAVGGVLAMTSLPWSLKLINGVVMDRFAFLAMGRRRPWLIAGQMAIVTGLLALAWANPGAQNAALLGAFAFAINVATTVQDVAIDGMAVDVIPEDEYGRANGFMFGGQAVGISAGSALSGYLIAYHGFSSAMLTLAALVGTILAVVILVRERPGEKLLPWTSGSAQAASIDRHLGAFWPICHTLFKAMFVRRTLIFIPAMFLGGAAYGLFTGLAPLHAAKTLGWGDDIYANWSGQAYLVGGIAGALVFGFLAERWGARRLYMASHLLTAASAAVLIVLLPGWTGAGILIAAIFMFTLLDVLRGVTGAAVAMRCCSPAVAATQFSLFMAINNLGISVSSASLGILDELGGISAMIITLVSAGVAGAAFAFAAKVGR
jgi:MFS transporter, PAT family, beta-lactamase induction signal transducer AmpG